MTIDDHSYDQYWKACETQYEKRCRGCGAYCGAEDGDPCIHLYFDSVRKRFLCNTYENRLGKQKTVSGRVFTCVLIRDVRASGGLRPACAYYAR